MSSPFLPTLPYPVVLPKDEEEENDHKLRLALDTERPWSLASEAALATLTKVPCVYHRKHNTVTWQTEKCQQVGLGLGGESDIAMLAVNTQRDCRLSLSEN